LRGDEKLFVNRISPKQSRSILLSIHGKRKGSSETANSRQCCACGSGIFIPDPDFYPSRIPDPKTATKERGKKKFVVIPFYVATNLTKSNIILVF
jgi:hypothetical protein